MVRKTIWRVYQTVALSLLALGRSQADVGGNNLLSSEPIDPIVAPFPMAQLDRPSIPALAVDIRDFGAREGGTVKNTQAIRRAIQKATSLGGGNVVIPPGIWLTGAISS